MYLDQDLVTFELIIDKCIEDSLGFLSERQHVEYIKQLIQETAAKFITLVKEKCQHTLPLNNANIIQQIVRLIKVCLKNESSLESLQIDDIGNWKKSLEKLTIFTYFWSVATGIPTTLFGRFEKILWDIFDLEPVKGTLQNYYFLFNKTGSEFLKWDLIIEPFKYQQNMSFFEMFVPTKESVCYSWFSQRFLRVQEPLFFTGPTGTGKTIVMRTVIKDFVETKNYQSVEITFTYQTKSRNTQDQMEFKLQYHRVKGQVVLMPPPQKTLLVFIDDANMPAKEVYGAQPAIELLRVFCEYGGFYCRQSHIWKQVKNTFLCCASGPSTNGRNQLSPQFIRYFTMLFLPPTHEESLNQIFSQILKEFLAKNNYRQEIKEFGEKGNLVQSTLQIYEGVTLQMLPIPSKAHYIFNLRDVAKVLQGMLMVKPQSLSSQEQFCRLWFHEVCRVFYDRLCTPEDRDWFQRLVMKTMQVNFKQDVEKKELFESENPILFGSFMSILEDKKKALYEEGRNFQRISMIMQTVMETQTALNLSLFKQAVEQIAYIARVLAQERGHMMLVAVGGSGKTSLTSLACRLTQAQFQQIEIKKSGQLRDFRDELFEILKVAGYQKEKVCLYLSDSSIRQEVFLDDINSLLNSGDISSILTNEQLEKVHLDLLVETRFEDDKNVSPYQLFINRVRQHLHIVMGFSPIGNQFRNRVRMFPSIVSCCTINWVASWPQEALLSVASKIFSEKLTFEGINEKIKNKYAELCVFVHNTVTDAVLEFKRRFFRNIYVTPKMFVDFIKTYLTLLEMKQTELGVLRDRLHNSLEKIQESKQSITVLQDTMKKLQPQLKLKTIQTDELIQKLEVDQ